MDLYLGRATLLTDPQILTSGCVTLTAHSIFFFFFAQCHVLESLATYLQKATYWKIKDMDYFICFLQRPLYTIYNIN
jgi:hypothetical protein